MADVKPGDTGVANWGLQEWSKIYGTDKTAFEPGKILEIILEKTLSTVDGVVTRFVGEAWKQVAELLQHSVTVTLFTIFIAYFGIQLLIGRAKFTMAEAAIRLFKMLVVYTLLTSGADLAVEAYKKLGQSAQLIGDALIAAGKSAPKGKGVLDVLQLLGIDIWSWYGKACSEFGGKWGVSGFGPRIAATFVLSVTLFALAYSLFLLVLAKAALGIILGIGPVIAGFLLFPTTRPIFDAWLKKIINYALIPVLIYGVWGLMLTVVYSHMVMLMVWFGVVTAADAAAALGGIDTSLFYIAKAARVVAMGPFVLLILATALLVSQVPQWAATLANSSALQDGMQLLYKKAHLASGGMPPGGRGGLGP